MTLRSAKLSDDGKILAASLLDELVCDCCQTDAAVAGDAVVVVYRNRSLQEIRDIYLVRNASGVWSEPAQVARDDWEIAGCPVNGPAVAARGAKVVVAWHTQAQQKPRVRFAASGDAGRSFDRGIEISTAHPLGRVDVVLLSDGRAVVSWMQTLAHKRQVAGIFIRTVSAKGIPGKTQLVAETGNTRPAGFPQMVLDAQDALILAWTDLGTEQIKTVRVTHY